MDFFRGTDFQLYSENIKEKVIEDIYGRTPAFLLESSLGDLIAYFVKMYTLDIVSIDLEHIQATCEENGKVRVRNQWRDIDFEKEFIEVDAVLFSYEIPILSGDEFLFFRPSSILMTRFDFGFRKGRNNEASVVIIDFGVKYSDLANAGEKNTVNQYIDSQYRLRSDGFFKMVQFMNSDINKFNQALSSIIGDALSKSIAQARVKKSVINKISIPLKSKGSFAETSQRIPLRISKAVVTYPAKTKTELEYFLLEEDYKKIIGVIRNHLTASEVTPEVIQKLKEEEMIRDTIIWTLSANFSGTSLETFRKSGKTDICIMQENKSAYIAECKIWHGEKYLHEAIDQLYRYSTWRDLKTSIILFNLDVSKFTDLLRQIPGYISSHPKFLSFVTKQANEWICNFESPYDSSGIITISFHIGNYCK